ncbi:C39 family peptidase [Mucilaginibacter segetis]|uniref:C39 family peptidase n=1 Tax=Mucilaginibacter segetis TaxID=2793071 RepID=A0A934PV97_9SPHI|nr:C39 family peptidase [Mucilaginibacter segetis]MBK0379633.1 C39 family peptidase [Mucilaginibacter segetis]
MNENYFHFPARLLATICFAVIVFYGCTKEDDRQISHAVVGPALDVSEAKNWYDINYNSTAQSGQNAQTFSVSNNKNPDYSKLVKPNWNKAVQYSEYGVTILEIPLDDPSKITSKFKSALSGNPTGKYTKTSFVFVKNNGKYMGFIRVLSADSAYSTKGLEKFNANSYNHMDADFGGSELLFTPTGDFVFGGIYTHGNFAPLVKYGANSSKTQSVKPNLVQDPGSGGGPVSDNPQVVCTSWYLDTYVDNVLVSSEYLGTSCSTTNTTQPNNGGGTAPPGGGNAQHQLANKNRLPSKNNTDQQVGGMCSFKTLEWISKYLGGNISVGTSFQWYFQNYQLNSQQINNILSGVDGISPQRVTELLDHYMSFTESAPGNIIGSINSGHPMMGLIETMPGNQHAVMITGYNDNGTIEYFDPETGHYASPVPPNAFVRVIEVSGFKPNN